MPRRARRQLRRLALFFALAPCLAVHAAPVLRVCLLANNLPYSSRATASGFDLEIAQAVARRGDFEFAPEWIDNATRMTEIEGDYPLARLARGACDAIFSIAGPGSDSLAGRPALTLGAPYYGAAFELLSCASPLPADLTAARGRKLAIQSQTVAHYAALRVGAEPVNYFSLQAAFEGARRGESDGALLWGPALGWLLRQSASAAAPAACQRLTDYQPPRVLRWNLHVATRTQDVALRAAIDTALRELSEAGELARVMASYGIPAREPFATTYDRAALEELEATP